MISSIGRAIYILSFPEESVQSCIMIYTLVYVIYICLQKKVSRAAP